MSPRVFEKTFDDERGSFRKVILHIFGALDTQLDNAKSFTF